MLGPLLMDRVGAIPSGDMPQASAQLLCPVLVGREQELGALGAALGAASSSAGRIVLLSGEAGVGKSALLRSFAEQARAAGARVLIGECTELEARRPLGPFLDTLDMARASGWLRSAEGRAIETGVVDTSSRRREYEAIVSAFAQLSRSATAVVAIEDLHWADAATLELFMLLARRVRSQRTVLVGTYRSDELHRRHPLRPVLVELNRARLAQEIAVSRLDDVALASMLRATLGAGELALEVRGPVQERCEGNPFFVEEVLRALAQRGDLAFADGAWHSTKPIVELAIPATVHDAVDARFQALSPEARRALQAAAVIGHRFAFDLVRDVLASDETDLVQHLRAAIDALLIDPDPEDPRSFAFRHALTRESIAADLLEPERRDLHGRIGQVLEVAGHDDAAYAERLAYHFDSAGDTERAYRYHLLAAESAQHAAAFARVADHLERAIVLAPADADVAWLYLRLAEAGWLTPEHHPNRAISAAEEATRRFKLDGRPAAAGRALTLLSRVLFGIDERRADEPVNEAVLLLEQLGPSAELANAYSVVARIAMSRDRPGEARALAERAVATAQAAGSAAEEAEALTTLGQIRMVEPENTEGLDLIRQSIDLARRNGLVAAAHRGYANFLAFGISHAPNACRSVYDEWAGFMETVGWRPDVLLMYGALVVLRDGDFDGVLHRCAQVSGQTSAAANTQLLEAFVRVARAGPAADRPDDVAAWLSVAPLSVASRGLTACIRLQLLIILAEAEQILAHAEEMWVMVIPHFEVHVLAALSAICVTHERQMSEAHERWLERAGQLAGGHPLDRLGPVFAEAEQASGRGDHAAAAGLFREAADGIGSLGMWVATTTLVRLRATEERLTFDRAGATAELNEAMEYWRRGKATYYLGELERWAVTHGLSSARKERAATPRALTAREVEVAKLVREGLTNRAIGERLVISERTVEGHVERILGKLGFNSRAQIAAWQVETASR